jgi:hypothetical protein
LHWLVVNGNTINDVSWPKKLLNEMWSERFPNEAEDHEFSQIHRLGE